MLNHSLTSGIYCTRGDSRWLNDCRRNCSLVSPADYDAHLAELSKLFSQSDYGFVSWRRLLDPLPTPPGPQGEPLRCPPEPPEDPADNR